MPSQKEGEKWIFESERLGTLPALAAGSPPKRHPQKLGLALAGQSPSSKKQRQTMAICLPVRLSCERSGSRHLRTWETVLVRAHSTVGKAPTRIRSPDLFLFCLGLPVYFQVM